MPHIDPCRAAMSPARHEAAERTNRERAPRTPGCPGCSAAFAPRTAETRTRDRRRPPDQHRQAPRPWPARWTAPSPQALDPRQSHRPRRRYCPTTTHKPQPSSRLPSSQAPLVKPPYLDHPGNVGHTSMLGLSVSRGARSGASRRRKALRR
ncbi:hypothetical protein SDC9_78023 [bioreactor metagenome]|uniref:Uncharacterized protein n=1 Tax=bioreactor metagenome TaxID=1076179 RepID=A0A644YU10_9ZZZZ